MNIETIAEHSVDIHMLPKKANILDAGCRGMVFTNHLRGLGHNVVALDCDILEGQATYRRLAISDHNMRVGVKRTKDIQATMICAGDEVDCTTIQKLCIDVDINFFDLIKLDIEGAEYEVIMSMDRPYAKQLSIEFHLHTGIYGEAEILLMENKLLSLGYFPVQHDKTKQHGLSYNYWDSLWVLI